MKNCDGRRPFGGVVGDSHQYDTAADPLAGEGVLGSELRK
jgi:hypothetical protein